MILLIDNSNRTTKVALGDATGMCEDWQCRLPSAGLDGDDVGEAVRDWAAVDSVAFCSVTEAGPGVLRALAAEQGLPCFELSSECTLIDLTRYPEPRTIGPDRLANAIAAAALCPDRPVVTIDAGTAITFSLVGPGHGTPVFLGGAISPGLGLFTRSLRDATDRLPAVDFPGEAPPAIGNSTLAAMQSAAWHGCAGMLNGVLDALCAELGQAAVVVSGSDADIVRSLLHRPSLHAPWLTLDGLRRAALAARV